MVLGGKHSEETRKKISLAKKGKKRQPFSTEHKLKISLSNKKTKRTEEYNQKLKKRTFTVISPDGQIVTSTGLNEFCRTHNLDRSGLRQLLKGKMRKYKGWRLYVPWE